MKYYRTLSLLIFLFLGQAAAAQSPFGGLLHKASKALDKTGSFKPGTAVSTSLKDSLPTISFLEEADFDAADAAAVPSFNLKPGYYKAVIRSYCLHAGAYGPSSGEGYQLCYFRGSKATLIQDILRKSAGHPDIAQQDVQTLIWGIESGLKFTDYPVDFQVRVRPLLDAEDIAAMEVNTSLVINKLMPESIRSLAETYRSFRNSITAGEMKYEELEKIALRSGLPPVGPGSKEIPKGVWSYIGNGFFMRVYPESYPTSTIELYRPAYLTVAKDEQGRIAAISRDNNKIVIQYDDAPGQDVVHTSSGQDVSVWRIKKVSFQGSSPEQVYTVENAGWIFRGDMEKSASEVSGLKPGTASAQTPPNQESGGLTIEGIKHTWDDLNRRYDKWKKRFDMWQDLNDGINEGYDATHRRPADYYFNEEYDNLQINDALKTALNPLDFKGKHKWLFEHSMMIRDLSYYITCSLAGNFDENNDPKEPPIWKYIAQPGNSSMQRLGLSPYIK